MGCAGATFEDKVDRIKFFEELLGNLEEDYQHTAVEELANRTSDEMITLKRISCLKRGEKQYYEHMDLG